MIVEILSDYSSANSLNISTAVRKIEVIEIFIDFSFKIKCESKFAKFLQRMRYSMLMKRKILCLCSVIPFIVCVLCFGFDTPTVKAASDMESYDEIADYLNRCVQNAHIPALTVTIVDKDTVLFSKNYGQCDNCDTPFVLGSVSKSFTAVCMMQLVEQGKVDLNDKISVYLPDAVDGDRIAVKQLLNHTSGLGEYQTLGNYKIINEQGVHNYANVNYSLLGKIIENVSGISYEDYLTQNVLASLHLSHTAASQEKSVENGLIDGYTNYWGFHLKHRHRYPNSESEWITVPAGYISSSANDLGRYLQMYLNGGENIISQESVNTMFYGDTVYVDDDVPFWYGYGWATVKEPLTEPVLRHSGLVETGTSCVYIMPESGIGIALTTNVNDYFVTNEMVDCLGWGVVLMILGEQPNEISENSYLLDHLRIDLIMLVVLAISILPLWLLPKYIETIKEKGIFQAVISTIIFHLFLPIFILFIIPLFFKTPLWVARAFVPDVFITIIISSTLLFVSGIAKTIILGISLKKH